jgi:mono/diheme cytochrome c family protein
MGEAPPVPEGVALSQQAEEGRLLFARYGCNSCHSISGHGREVAVDLAHVDATLSRQEYRAYILNPPEGIAMPAYEGRITEQELEALLDFVHAAQAFPREIRK